MMAILSFIFMGNISKMTKSTMIFVQPGFFRIMIVKPLVLSEEHITCKTPTVKLICNYVNYSSAEASVFACSSKSGCYCEKDRFAYVKVHVITNYAPQIRQWQKYASDALQFLYYRSKFAITGAGPKMSYEIHARQNAKGITNLHQI